MRIVHINASDINGGAARAAYRIHHGVLEKGEESIFFVKDKQSDDKTVVSVSSKKEKVKQNIARVFDLSVYCCSNVTKKTTWSIGENIFSRVGCINALKPDIINLHWINGDFINIRDLRRLNAPIVWTLHDMWPFTGGCHYNSDGCYKYKSSCHNCEQLLGDARKDLSKWVFKRKADLFPDHMTIVTPSNWLGQEARSSRLFSKYNVEVIHNGIDTNKYFPRNRDLARELLGLPKDKRIVLFGAMSSTSDKRKGFQYLYPAIRSLYDNHKEYRGKVNIVVFGSSGPKDMVDFGFGVKYTGHLYDDISLNLLYSAADVMVVPSHADNFPNTILEAMACGTPCVGFDVGGIPDFIEHKKDGYIAQPYDINDLANGILYVIENKDREYNMSVAARNKVLESFSLKIVAEKYITLYRNVLTKDG